MSGDINHQTFELLLNRLDTQDATQERIERKIDDGFGKLNGRVRKLENWRWYLMGGGAACLILLGFLLK